MTKINPTITKVHGRIAIAMFSEYLLTDGTFSVSGRWASSLTVQTFEDEAAAQAWIDGRTILTIEEAIKADRLPVPCIVTAGNRTTPAAEELADALSEGDMIVKVERYADQRFVWAVIVELPQTVAMPALSTPVFEAEVA